MIFRGEVQTAEWLEVFVWAVGAAPTYDSPLSGVLTFPVCWGCREQGGLIAFLVEELPFIK